MHLVDMITIRFMNKTILVEDRWSEDNTPP